MFPDAIVTTFEILKLFSSYVALIGIFTSVVFMRGHKTSTLNLSLRATQALHMRNTHLLLSLKKQ